MNLLVNVGGVTDTDTLIAAVLHDAAEVTDDPTLTKAEMRAAQVANVASKSVAARQIKLADKFHNVFSIKASPPEWTVERARCGRRMQECMRPLEILFDALIIGTFVGSDGIHRPLIPKDI